MLRIFSRKAYRFDHPAGEENPVYVKMQDFVDVPDWVEDSSMFKLAKKEGSLEVIGSRQDELNAEKGSNNKRGGNNSKNQDPTPSDPDPSTV